MRSRKIQKALLIHAMRRHPIPFPCAVFAAIRPISLRPIPATCLPCHAFPSLLFEFFVAFAIVAAQDNPQTLILAILKAPFAARGGNVILNCIQFVITLLVRIRRVKEHGSQSLLDRWRWTAHARPITAANPHAPHPGGKNLAVIVYFTPPSIAEVGEFLAWPMDTHPRIAEVGEFLAWPMDTHPRIAEVGELLPFWMLTPS